MKKKDKGGQTFTSTVRITKMLLGMVWRQPLGRVYLVLKFFISVLNAVIPTVYTVFSGLIINELTGGLRIDRLITYVAVMVVTPTVMFFINHFYSKYELILQSELTIRFEADFFGNVLDMDYENLEIPAIQVKKIRANTTVMGLLRVVNMISGAVAALFSLIAVTSIISTLNPVILIVMIAVIIVNYIVSKDNDRKVYELDRERSKKEMVSSVYRYMLEDAKSAKEVRMFAMKDFLIDNYSEQQRASSAVRLKIFNKQSVSSYVGAAMDFIKEASLYAVVLFEVLKRALPIGNMTIYMASARQFSGAVSGVMHSYRTLSSNSLQTQDYIDFMNMPNMRKLSGDTQPDFGENSVVEFKDVSFRYPDSDRYALKNLNLSFKCGEKLCIVGENGSGKSTFIKLLMRLYDPTEGVILLNGRDIREYDFPHYQKMFAAVFQDFAEYPLTVGKNIALTNSPDNERLDDVCRRSGLEELMSKLPKKYDTPIGKEIFSDGFNPSGGEGQRIAIARALYKGGDIYILDEPTAALDPNAEYEIYTRFHRMIEGKTAVLITHRLSAVQLADKVAVFADGHVEEYGTHAELYARGGMYREMFDKQSEFYVKAAQSEEQE